jgi:glycosyltransferase involved in cell wall biosynthesis
VNLIKKTILIISPESWGTSHVSKHHYALELSKENLVFFLNPPSSDNTSIQHNKNLWILNYRQIIRGINRLPSFLRNKFNRFMINKILLTGNIRILDIVWSFDSYRFQNLHLFNSQLRIYHPVDVHKTSLEKEICKSASIVFTTCELIKTRLKTYNSNIYNIGHGLSDRFIIESANEKRKEGPLKVCMMGNLQRRIDYPLLFRLIEDNSTIEFHFIGPYLDSNLSREQLFRDEINHLRSYSNTCLHGPIDHEKLPILLNDMDVFLILYRDDENPATLANPHKVLEYLSTGKVILSNFMEEYKDREDLLVMTKNRKKIPQLLSEIINNIYLFNSSDKKKKRRDFAIKNQYQKKIRDINFLLQDVN